MTTRMCDLPPKLVGEKILTRVPITSLRAVRSTCKLWNALTKDWILGKTAAAGEQFLGFMTMNSKVCSVRFHLCRNKDKEVEEDLLEISTKQVDLLNQVDISKVFHCDGLLLCVAKDNSRHVVWNPYLGQTRWIGPRTEFHRLDSYALGYDMNRNHKILRFVDHSWDQEHVFGYEIYDISSNSWRVLKASPDWKIVSHQPGVSVKGNTNFFAHEKIGPDFAGGKDLGNGCRLIVEIEDFLLCFDFTRERFGPRLPLPFHSYNEETVTISCVRDEQLAILYHQEGRNHNRCNIVEIWVTTMIEPNSVSWSKFLKVEMRPFALTGVWFNNYKGGSFFINEEERVAVVFDIDGYLPTESARYHTAFIIGEDGYYKTVSLGVAPIISKPCPISGYIPKVYCPPLVCTSSYPPSLVQLNQTPKGKKEMFRQFVAFVRLLVRSVLSFVYI